MRNASAPAARARRSSAGCVNPDTTITTGLVEIRLLPYHT